jgi:hypothetical protein
VEDRGPLQKLEREYDPFQRSSPYARDVQPQLPSRSDILSSPSDYSRDELPSSGRRKSYNDGRIPLRPTLSANDASMSDHTQDSDPMAQRYGTSPVDDFRHSMSYDSPRRAQTFDNLELYDPRQTRRTEPVIVRPRAISPNPSHSIPRKSITPSPTTPEDRKPMSSIPYGPDSYDVLNPGPSPTVEDDLNASTDSGREAARQREVDRMRDQGPIIGNDGRVIDPSDHLPADTWAPEPERKNRKPEHVIKIRTREEARMQQSGVGSSPVSARPSSFAASPYQSSPHAAVSSPFQPSSPAGTAPPPISPLAEPPSTGRNRLKKAIPGRPLPPQPYPQQTTPASPAPAMPAASSPFDVRPSPSSQRYSIHSSPAVPQQRPPPAADYQVPATNNYSPRGVVSRQDYPSTPTRAPLHRPGNSMDYGGYSAENPLALELSMIDIGPSRGPGRTSLRPIRGYGAY